MQLFMFDNGREAFTSWKPRLAGDPDIRVGSGNEHAVSGVVRVGTLLTEFLALRLEDRQSFERFVKRFGLEPFGRYLSELEEFSKLYRPDVQSGTVNCEISFADLDRFRRYLCSLESLTKLVPFMLKGFVREWFDLEEEWAKGLSPIERYCYKPNNTFLKMLSDCDWGIFPMLLDRNNLSTRHPEIHDDKAVPLVGCEEYRSVLSAFKAHIVDFYFSINIVTLCCIEIRHMLRLEQTLRICRNCGNYFVPNRTDEVYCHLLQRTSSRKIGPGKYVGFELTCQDIGPQEAYKNKLKNDPLMAAYRNSYKRLNAKVNVGTLSRDDFGKWTREAKMRLKQVRMGTVTTEDFIAWTRQKVIPNGG